MDILHIALIEEDAGASPDDDGKTTTIYTIAVLCSLIASFGTATSFILMKIANIKVEKMKSGNKRCYCQKEWLTGLALLIIGSTFNYFALKLGSIIVIASTSGVTILLNAILSPLMLGENFNWQHDSVTVFLIVSGCTMAAIQIPSKSEPLSEEIIIERLRALPAIIYQGFLIVLIIFRIRYAVVLDQMLNEFYEQCINHYIQKTSAMEKNYILPSPKIEEETNCFNNSRRATSLDWSQKQDIQDPLLSRQRESSSLIDIKNKMQKHDQPFYNEHLPLIFNNTIEKPSNRILIQIIMRNSKEDIKLLTGAKSPGRGNYFSIRFHVRGFLLLTSIYNGCLVGVLNSSTKFLTEMVANDDDVMGKPLTYLFIACIVLSVFFNIYNMNVSGRYYSQLFVTPFVESSSIMFNLVSGLVLVGEYDRYTDNQLVIILIGCLISIMGIMLKLTTLESQEKNPKLFEEKFQSKEEESGQYVNEDEMIKSDTKVKENDDSEEMVAGGYNENPHLNSINQEKEQRMQENLHLMLGNESREIKFQEIVSYLKNESVNIQEDADNDFYYQLKNEI